MKANENTQQARSLIAGAFSDFLERLATLPGPIIVGGGYPLDRMLNVFQAWTVDIGFDTSDADVPLWRAACQHGFFKKG
jgi:hypothetical protein